MQEQVHPQRDCCPWKTHAGAEETNEKGGKQKAAETNSYAPTLPAPPITTPMRLSVTCSDNKESGDQEGRRKGFWNEVELGRGRGFFSLSV